MYTEKGTATGNRLPFLFSASSITGAINMEILADILALVAIFAGLVPAVILLIINEIGYGKRSGEKTL